MRCRSCVPRKPLADAALDVTASVRVGVGIRKLEAVAAGCCGSRGVQRRPERTGGGCHARVADLRIEAVGAQIRCCDRSAILTASVDGEPKSGGVCAERQAGREVKEAGRRKSDAHIYT